MPTAVSLRCKALALSDYELALDDAPETNDSALKVLGDETRRTVARERVAAVRRTID